MCDNLPDISKTVAYDNVDSAEQFFSIPPPEGVRRRFPYPIRKLISLLQIHPAVFLDNRSGPNIMTYASAVSRWLAPCRYVYVRLLSSGFPNQGYKVKKHELEVRRSPDFFFFFW